MNVRSYQQFDALKEIVNIGVGRAAAALNEMLDAHIELKVPTLCFFNPRIAEEIPPHLRVDQLSCVQMGFSGKFQGTSALVFPPESAVKLVAALTGQEAGAPGMNAVMAGTLNEVGNILLNSVMGTIANILEKPFEYTFPSYLEGSLEHLLASPEITRETLALMVQTNFAVREMQIEGNVFLLLELKAFETLVGMLNDLFKGTLH